MCLIPGECGCCGCKPIIKEWALDFSNVANDKREDERARPRILQGAEVHAAQIVAETAGKIRA
jgi:hypothetical protein